MDKQILWGVVSGSEPKVGRELRRRRTLTMRVTLLALILCLLVASGLAINAIWFVKSRATAQALSDQFFSAFSKMVAQRTDDLLGPAALLLRQNQIEAQRGLIVVSDVADLGMRLAERLRARPNLTQLYHANASTGEFIGASQAGTNTIALIQSSPDVDNGAFSEWTVYPDGSRGQYRREPRPGFDARHRPWFEMAVRDSHDRLVWTDPYVFFRTQLPGITAAQAWRLPGDTEPRGVFAADFSLEKLASFLTESANLEGSRSFLVTRGGQIIVGSRQGAGDPDDAVWPAVQAALPSPVDTMRMNTPVNVAAEYEGKTYLGVVQVFRVTGGPDWALVSIVPEARFLAASIANTKIAAAVGLLIVVVAISLGWVVSDRVARPLLKMTNVLERIGRFELSGKATSSSFITEIAVVGDSVDRMQASLRSFSHYVPIDLVREVIASGKEAQLGGANRDLTLLISDIAGFTAISEQLTPNTLVAQLAQYLDAMTDAITAEGGTIDKYVGDGIVAFFNAPTLLPEHAIAACRAALAAQKALHSLQEEWAARGMPAFVTRIGINRGEVVVGNIGTHERFAYTAMGDAMNLASRLEGLNKIYGTRLLASEAVWEEAKSQFEWRRLDRVAVVGRSQSTLVFELLGEVGRLPQAALDARDQYETALDAYFSGHFSTAAAGFGLAGRMRPDDQAAEVMLQRILDLAQSPPGPQWNGIFASREK